MIILLILLFILAIFRIIRNNRNEGFEELSKDTINNYNEFKTFYNVFMSNWKKAVITSLSLNKEPVEEKLQKPTKPPTPTNTELNIYIKKLSETFGELPKITNPFPDEIDKITLQKIFITIPDKPDGYIHALTWMNKNLKEALSSVQGFLDFQGFLNLQGFLDFQGFEDMKDMCKNAHKCIENANKCIEEEQKQNEGIMMVRIKKLLADETLKRLMKENIDLMKQADDVKKKAESGELLNEYKSDEKSSKPEMPEGGDLLSKLKKIDPAAYNAKINENKNWASIKLQLEQINSISN